MVDELERLKAELQTERSWREELQFLTIDQAVEIGKLRAALTEMLESFTEPEDDNDILRRARDALGRTYMVVGGRGGPRPEVVCGRGKIGALCPGPPQRPKYKRLTK